MGVRVGVDGDVDGEVMEGSLGGKTTVDRKLPAIHISVYKANTVYDNDQMLSLCCSKSESSAVVYASL